MRSLWGNETWGTQNNTNQHHNTKGWQETPQGDESSKLHEEGCIVGKKRKAHETAGNVLKRIK